jgi:hypothetical protein
MLHRIRHDECQHTREVGTRRAQDYGKSVGQGTPGGLTKIETTRETPSPSKILMTRDDLRLWSLHSAPALRFGLMLNLRHAFR